MGLVDSLMNMVGGGDTSKLVSTAQNLLEQSGGLDGLVGKFRESGLGDIADSWVGTGDNKAVSPDQIRQALGDDTIAKVAQDAGVSNDDALSGITRFLPGIVNELTPDGKIPDMGQVTEMLGNLDLGSLSRLLK